MDIFSNKYLNKNIYTNKKNNITYFLKNVKIRIPKTNSENHQCSSQFKGKKILVKKNMYSINKNNLKRYNSRNERLNELTYVKKIISDYESQRNPNFEKVNKFRRYKKLTQNQNNKLIEKTIEKLPNFDLRKLFSGKKEHTAKKLILKKLKNNLPLLLTKDQTTQENAKQKHNLEEGINNYTSTKKKNYLGTNNYKLFGNTPNEIKLIKNKIHSFFSYFNFNKKIINLHSNIKSNN